VRHSFSNGIVSRASIVPQILPSYIFNEKSGLESRSAFVVSNITELQELTILEPGKGVIEKNMSRYELGLVLQECGEERNVERNSHLKYFITDIYTQNYPLKLVDKKKRETFSPFQVNMLQPQNIIYSP